MVARYPRCFDQESISMFSCRDYVARPEYIFLYRVFGIIYLYYTQSVKWS